MPNLKTNKKDECIMKRKLAGLVVVVAMALVLAACGSSSDDGSDAEETVAVSKVNGRMLGPLGEESVDASKVSLSSAEEKKLKEGNHTAALVWHEDADLTRALTRGIEHRFGEMGIEIVGVTDAEFDPAKQQRDLDGVLARNPDAIISIPVDPTTAAEAYRPALQRGTKLVFLSNVPEGYVHGKDYVGVVSSDQIATGENTAKILGEALGGEGKIGYINFDAEFFITNQRDNAFKQALKANYPGIDIAATAGFQDPEKVEEIAAGMVTRNPDLDGIYTTWAQPAEGVLAALREAGRESEVKIATVDLSEPIALNIAEGGAVAGVSADPVFAVGEKLAEEAGLGILGKPAPAFAVLSSIAVTKSNLLEGWETSFGVPAPAGVQGAVE